MKFKLKNKNSNLPNAWKQCGVSKEDWEKLKSGGEIDVKVTVSGMEHLVEVISAPIKKYKGEK